MKPLNELLISNLKDGILKFEIETMDDFNSAINQLLDYPHYVWRGQRDANWLLEPTLNRVLKDFDNPSNRIVDKHLENFRYSSRGRRGSNPNLELTDDEWWALGQHHGLATPLLDWSTSPYVAAFFAFSEDSTEENSKRIIYGLNRGQIEKKSNNDIITGDDLISFVKPFSDDNPRLLNQSGLFTKGPIRKDLESWVKNYFVNDKHAVLIKIFIPNEQQAIFLKALNRMNINYSTLYPDLVGASLHCNMSLKISKYLE